MDYPKDMHKKIQINNDITSQYCTAQRILTKKFDGYPFRKSRSLQFLEVHRQIRRVQRPAWCYEFSWLRHFTLRVSCRTDAVYGQPPLRYKVESGHNTCEMVRSVWRMLRLVYIEDFNFLTVLFPVEKHMCFVY